MADRIYLIKRGAKLTLDGGFPCVYWTRWRRTYGTAAARDAALARTRKRHPTWMLKAADVDLGWLGVDMDTLFYA